MHFVSPDHAYWSDELEMAVFERQEANELSEMRANVAPFLGYLTANAEGPADRLLAAVALGYYWYTDRQDGQKGRRSVARAQSVAECGIPELELHPDTLHLTNPATLTEGGQKDNLADKDLSGELLDAQAEKASSNDQYLDALVLKAVAKAERVRNQLMAETRGQAQELGVDIKASWAGKAKTLTQAVASVGSTIAKPGSRLHKLSTGLNIVSLAPSLFAVYKLRKQIGEARKQS